MIYHIRLALSSIIIFQFKFLSFPFLWMRIENEIDSKTNKKHDNASEKEINFIFRYFQDTNFTKRFYFKNRNEHPEFLEHSAICIPKHSKLIGQCDIYLFNGEYPINRGSYGTVFVGRKVHKNIEIEGEKIIIKFQNNWHKKKHKNDWIKNYANHLQNEIYYLRKFGHLRLLSEKQEYDSEGLLRETSVVLAFDFIEGHHIYYLINNGFINSMELFAKIQTAVFHELNKFHENGFCHGDLHGQNFLIQLPQVPEDDVKLSFIDFGWTQSVKETDGKCIEVDFKRLKEAFERVKRCLERNLVRLFIKPCEFSPF
jgi:tRNA A-37 threonylcarbamoyl transferase component Bud32